MTGCTLPKLKINKLNEFPVKKNLKILVSVSNNTKKISLDLIIKMIGTAADNMLLRKCNNVIKIT